MMRESECRSAKSPKHIEIGSLGSQRERESRQRRFAIEPGPSQARAGQKMCDGFQVAILLSEKQRRQIAPNSYSFQPLGISKVSAFGTIVISAGRVPSNSPSAST
jgi:hypothetical protein